MERTFGAKLQAAFKPVDKAPLYTLLNVKGWKEWFQALRRIFLRRVAGRC